MPPTNSAQFLSLIQRFFAEHLIAQRDLSPQTIAAYRDTFRLLLRFLSTQLRRPVDQIGFAALSPERVLKFLEHLEQERGNCVRTRNLRLAALRSFIRFALAHADPDAVDAAQRILAIPFKRGPRTLLHFLTREEVAAILAALDDSTLGNCRDRVFFTLLYNTGARVSELIHLRAGDLSGQVVQLHGKGRKERCVPLWPETRHLLQQWCRRQQIRPDQPIFTNQRGVPLTRSGVNFRLTRAVSLGARTCSGLRGRRISSHIFRHTTALHLLQAGVAIEVIALWLGHESPVTTHNYVEADLKMKADCLKMLESPPAPRRLRRAQFPRILAFLEAL